MRHRRLVLLAGLAGMFCFGCTRNSASPPEPTEPPASLPGASGAVSEAIIHIHWMGKAQMAAETNAAGILLIWNEPESARLEAQTLDKLAGAPWRLLPHVATTNAAAPLLRPLLEDCIQQESYLEVGQRTGSPGEVAFAIRLSQERAALWRTNLANVLESLTGIRPEPAPGGWSLRKHHAPNLIEMARSGDWTIVSAGQDTNILLREFIGRIQRNQAPSVGSAKDFWLSGSVELQRLVRVLGLETNLPDGLPDISFTVNGEGGSVLTSGDLKFSKPLTLDVEPWNLPTNLMGGMIGSFTAVRGLTPWLDSQKAWTNLKLGPAPNQFYTWASSGIPLATLFAVPVSDVSNRMTQVSDLVLARLNPWLVGNGSGHIELSAETKGIVWSGIPFMGPYIRAEHGFIHGGFLPSPRTRRSLPEALIAELNHTNLIYYDWEVTGPRLEAWFNIGQLLRVLMHKAQLPVSVSMTWLKTNSNLGPCVTAIKIDGPDQLAFIRKSAVGFTAIELQLLADWFESPQFPKGLNTFLGPQDILRKRRMAPPPAPVSTNRF